MQMLEESLELYRVWIKTSCTLW